MASTAIRARPATVTWLGLPLLAATTLVGFVALGFILLTFVAGVRLPWGLPGAFVSAVVAVGLHYLLIHYDIPDVDAASWRLEVDGAVRAPVSFSLGELRAPTLADMDRRINLLRTVLRSRGLDDARLRIVDITSEEGEAFTFRTGQFGLYGVFGEGESTFCIASSPTRKGYIECTFREAGRVTAALADRDVGDVIGFRGPYGNVFPIESWTGKSLVFVAGGIALPPLRSVIWNCLDLRDRYRDVTILYGARTVADLVYKRELEEWAARPDVNLVVTVDPGGETPDWKGKVGFVPHVVEQQAPSSANAVAIVCGPPIMIKLTLPVLAKLGFGKGDIYTTLENRMKCGLGKCGRCNIGPVYVCKDGPVFTLAQIKQLPPEF